MGNFVQDILSKYNDPILANLYSGSIIEIYESNKFDRMIEYLTPPFIFVEFNEYEDGKLLQYKSTIKEIYDVDISEFESATIFFEYNSVIYSYTIPNNYYDNCPTFEQMYNNIKNMEQSAMDQLRHKIEAYIFGDPEFAACKNSDLRTRYARKLVSENRIPDVDLITYNFWTIDHIVDEYWKYLKYRGQL